MKTDVQSLIAVLTTERDSIDRAIAALRQISQPTTPTVARVAPVRARRHPRTPISDDVKRLIVARMAGAESYGETAKVIAREYGMSWTTVRSTWSRWQKQFATPVNGDAPMTQDVPQHELQSA